MSLTRFVRTSRRMMVAEGSSEDCYWGSVSSFFSTDAISMVSKSDVILKPDVVG